MKSNWVHFYSKCTTVHDPKPEQEWLAQKKPLKIWFKNSLTRNRWRRYNEPKAVQQSVFETLMESSWPRRYPKDKDIFVMFL